MILCLRINRAFVLDQKLLQYARDVHTRWAKQIYCKVDIDFGNTPVTRKRIGMEIAGRIAGPEQVGFTPICPQSVIAYWRNFHGHRKENRIRYR